MATLKKLTPVLFVDEIEPCLPFWEKLEFVRTVEVPEGERLGFVILAKDAVEVMYQSRASVRKDLPTLEAMPSCAVLYLEVDDLDAVGKAVSGAPETVARRRTPYGAHEFGVREPGGNIVLFAAR